MQLLTVIKILLFPCFLFAETATVSWDPNTENDLSGYKIYYGPSSINYDNVIDVGNTTSFTINGLVAGVIYFFVVTAYDFSGNESGFSKEVNFTPTQGPDDLRKYRVANINFNRGEVPQQPANWSKDEHPVELLFNGEDIDWGNWDASHIYSTNFSVVRDTVFTFQIFDSFYGDNSGSLDICIQETSVVEVRFLMPCNSFSVKSDGRIVKSQTILSGTSGMIIVSGTFNYWNTNAWANADAEYTQTR